MKKQAFCWAPGLPGALFLLLLASSAAQGGLFSDDEARQGLADLKAQHEALSKQQQTLDERVTRMESILESYPDTVNKLDTLSQDLAQLRGKLDVLGNQIDTVDKHVHELYLDLDSRLKLLEAASKPADTALVTDAAPDTKAAEATPAPASYDSALAAFNKGDYAASLKQFQAFRKANPKDPKTVNALYWVGMNQLSLKDYKGARATNQELYKNYPESSKAPDALLNLASAWTGLGDAANAKATLKILMNKYPGSPAAAKAKARMQER